jgi:hypothetical protein
MADNTTEVNLEVISEDIFNQLMDDAPVKTDAPTKVDPKVDLEPEKKIPTRREKAPEGDDTDKVEPPTKTDDEVSKDIDGTFDDTLDGDDEGNGDADTSILEAKYKGLVERGIWQEIELPADFEWSDETYGEIASTQAQWKAEEMFNEMLDQSGDYGKAIFNHIKNGGNPDEIITLFKESKKLEGLDITTEDGQQQAVRDYYTKVMGWSEAKTTRFINSAIDRKELKTEAEEVKGLMDKEIKKQLQETEKEQAAKVEAQKAANEQFAKSMEQAIASREDFSAKEQKQLMQNLLVFDQKLSDGRVANKFTMDYMALKSDPAKFVDLIAFVSNPEKYIEKVSKKAETNTAKKTWEFIKNSGSLNRATGTTHSSSKNSKEKDLVIDYRTLSRD